MSNAAAVAMGKLSNAAQAKDPAKYKADRIKAGRLAGLAKARNRKARMAAK